MYGSGFLGEKGVYRFLWVSDVGVFVGVRGYIGGYWMKMGG